jgi:hypothetical protein
MPGCQERTAVHTPTSRDTPLTAAREDLASRGYDATNPRRGRRRNRDSKAAVSYHSQDEDRLSMNCGYESPRMQG